MNDGYTLCRTATSRLYNQWETQRLSDLVQNGVCIELAEGFLWQSYRNRGLNACALNQNLGDRLIPGQTGCSSRSADERHSRKGQKVAQRAILARSTVQNRPNNVWLVFCDVLEEVFVWFANDNNCASIGEGICNAATTLERDVTFVRDTAAKNLHLEVVTLVNVWDHDFPAFVVTLLGVEGFE